MECVILQKGKVNFHFLVDLFGITSSYFISVRRKPCLRMDIIGQQSSTISSLSHLSFDSFQSSLARFLLFLFVFLWPFISYSSSTIESIAGVIYPCFFFSVCFHFRSILGRDETKEFFCILSSADIYLKRCVEFYFLQYFSVNCEKFLTF